MGTQTVGETSLGYERLNVQPQDLKERLFQVTLQAVVCAVIVVGALNLEGRKSRAVFLDRVPQRVCRNTVCWVPSPEFLTQ